MRVEITAHAQHDLAAIYAHLNSHSPDAAERTLDRIEQRCLSLARDARRGTPLRSAAYPGLRRVIEAQYVIIYQPSKGTVWILRVLHGARDLEHALSETTSPTKGS